MACHKEMNGKKASGVDEVTKSEYEENLETNVEDLISRMKRQAYKPQPAKRVYMRKIIPSNYFSTLLFKVIN